MSENSLQQIELKQQDIIVSLKDMELRLNNAIAQSQKIVAAAPVMTVPVMQQDAKIAPEATAEASSVPEPDAFPETPEEDLPDDIEQLLKAAPENAAAEAGGAPGVEAEAEIGAAAEVNASPEIDASGERGTVPEAEAAAGTEAAPEAEPAPEVEAAPEEKPPMPDLSDPNKKMSADDIAALFAAMT
jgi:hypothetical protein